jgi:hypothetical protein
MEDEEQRLLDATHCDLVNELISTMNDMIKRGYCIDMVASASVAAAATFSHFNLSEKYTVEVDDVRIMTCAVQFGQRMREVREAITSSDGR